MRGAWKNICWIDWCWPHYEIFSALRPVGVFNLWHRQLNHIKGNKTLVLMHSGIVKGISCCAMLILILCLNHIGNLKLFSILLIKVFFHFFFLCVCHYDSPISVLGCLFSWVNNLKRTANLVLWFPDRTAVCTHPWHDAYITL